MDLECLDLIQIGGPATPGQIRQRTGFSSGAVTGLIDRLERLGFVRRTADTADRRKVLVHIVPERLGTIEALFEPMRVALDALLTEYNETFLEDVAAFMEQAEKLTIERVTELNDQNE
jgi:DNA-binding MarR family transcriptional regulator